MLPRLTLLAKIGVGPVKSAISLLSAQTRKTASAGPSHSATRKSAV